MVPLSATSVVPGTRTSTATAHLDEQRTARYEFDLVWDLDHHVLPDARALQVDLIVDGQTDAAHRGAAGVTAARGHHLRVREELPVRVALSRRPGGAHEVHAKRAVVLDLPVLQAKAARAGAPGLAELVKDCHLLFERDAQPGVADQHRHAALRHPHREALDRVRVGGVRDVERDALRTGGVGDVAAAALGSALETRYRLGDLVAGHAEPDLGEHVDGTGLGPEDEDENGGSPGSGVGSRCGTSARVPSGESAGPR